MKLRIGKEIPITAQTGILQVEVTYTTKEHIIACYHDGDETTIRIERRPDADTRRES